VVPPCHRPFTCTDLFPLKFKLCQYPQQPEKLIDIIHVFRLIPGLPANRHALSVWDAHVRILGAGGLGLECCDVQYMP
jgi:hypothetical protein